MYIHRQVGEYGRISPLLPLGRRFNAHFHTLYILLLKPVLHFSFILFHLINFLIQWLNKATPQRYNNCTAYLLPPSSTGGQNDAFFAFLINTKYIFCILYFWLAVSFKLNFKAVERIWIFFFPGGTGDSSRRESCSREALGFGLS